MVVITAGRTSDIEYDVKALFSEWAIHRFLYKVSSLKRSTIYASRIVLRESCLSPCELLMIEAETNCASDCFKEIAKNTKVINSTVLETPETSKL